MAEDVTRLPKWAQGRISMLEQRLGDALDHIETLSSPEANADTDTLVFSYGVRPDVKLEKGAMIRFTLPEGNHVDVRVRGTYLDVTTDHGSILAQPQSSNVMRIRAGEWW